ncbi:MAG: polymer-forming cytoskeletal protein [Candidatus Cloacimonetes bacterium]|nr:polymer-forming cytoskeletal protein [Candidatus Cloacimonadota bacterium]MBL7107795.1 polymer-forming cytoskeletal protein [Candidatus Cloacimonadota bacterium]
MKEMSENLNTIIGKDSKVIGEIHSEGSLRIDGKVEGAIEAKGFLTVGATAEIKAEIKTKEALIAGTIDGNVFVDEKLELEKTAKINGDIHTKVLTVNTGARFNGKCQMGSQTNKNPIHKKEDEPKKPEEKEPEIL